MRQLAIIMTPFQDLELVETGVKPVSSTPESAQCQKGESPREKLFSALKKTQSELKKRQGIGRGLRLSVNKEGLRTVLL